MSLMWLLSTKVSEFLVVCNFTNIGICHVGFPGSLSKFLEQLSFCEKTKWTVFATIQSNTSSCFTLWHFLHKALAIYLLNDRSLWFESHIYPYSEKKIFGNLNTRSSIWTYRIILHGFINCWIACFRGKTLVLTQQ